MGLSRGFYMTVYFDANNIYDAGTKAMQSSKFKHGTQLFEMNHLLTTAHIRQDFITGDYKPDPGNKFPINERGHPRYITSNTMVDKTVNHLLCDEVLTPSISKYLIYDNGASQKGKGVAFHRRRFEARLHQYFMQNGTNEGYILLVDFSGYYANIPHDKCLEVLQTFLEREVEDPETLAITEMLLPLIFKTFEQDVSRFTDKEIEAMMAGKIDPMLNYGVDPALLTGEKMLRKGVDIGSQPSQNIGIVYPYRLDNYAKIVKAVKGYGRYTDDSYAIARTREELLELLDGLEKEAKEYGLIINRKKTRIVKLSSEFRHLQVCYSLTETGRVIRKINPKNITRERRKLKAYKRLLDSGRIDYATVENAFKSWLGSHWKNMSHDQVYNMSSLYYELFGRRPKWKKRTWKITLADGTSLDGLDLNGNNYISSTAVTEDTFTGKLSSVTIEGPDGTQTYQDMKLVQISKVGKSYWFILAEKTAEEKQKELAAAALATNANSITDLQLALAEVYEMIIGGK